MPEVLGQCPICASELVVVRQQCRGCGTALEGTFTLPRLLRLPPDQLQFVERFVHCRGVIRDLEHELGISYPTVRARLDEVIRTLEANELEEEVSPSGDASPPETSGNRAGGRVPAKVRQAALDGLAAGALSPDEAIQRLRGEAPGSETAAPETDPSTAD